MGRIFSYEEIESGRIPTPDDFEMAKDVFCGIVQAEIDGGHFDGGIIHGSVAAGTNNIRSDFDSLISLTDDNPVNYQAARSLGQMIRRQTGGTIPIDVMPRTKLVLAEGRHDIDRFFGQHLSCEDRIVCGNDPSEYITYWGQNISAKDILANYLFHKKRRMAETYTLIEPLDISNGGIQRMLELPNAIGRKALQALAEVRGTSDEPLDRSANKESLLRLGHNLFEEYGIAEGFDLLISANMYYDEVLTETLAGEIERHDYEEVIHELHDTLPLAVKWVEQVQTTILPLLDVSK